MLCRLTGGSDHRFLSEKQKVLFTLKSLYVLCVCRMDLWAIRAVKFSRRFRPIGSHSCAAMLLLHTHTHTYGWASEKRRSICVIYRWLSSIHFSPCNRKKEDINMKDTYGVRTNERVRVVHVYENRLYIIQYNILLYDVWEWTENCWSEKLDRLCYYNSNLSFVYNYRWHYKWLWNNVHCTIIAFPPDIHSVVGDVSCEMRKMRLAFIVQPKGQGKRIRQRTQQKHN